MASSVDRMPETPIPVCITVKNDIKNIEGCLESVRNQDYPLYLIVQDAASTDGTSKVVQKYADRVIVEDTNISMGRNVLINFVLHNFDSEFLVFVDSDVILPREWLRTAVEICKRMDKCGGLGSFQLKPARLFDKTTYFILDIPNSENFEDPIVRYHNAPCTAVIYRTSALRDLHRKYGYYFNEDLRAGEDPELSHRLIQMGWSVYLSKHLMIRHSMKVELKSFWRQQFLYGKGLKDFSQIGFSFDSSRRVKQLLFAPIAYGAREKDPSLFFVMCFYLAVKILANVLGRYS
jgi:glycosyltransferase involved in cell wall biosynthesis